MINILLFGILIMSFILVISKRISAMINAFGTQSFFLFLFTLLIALRSRHLELYIVVAMLFFLKVITIPFLLRRITKRIKINEFVGLFVNSAVSILIAVLLTYLAYLFVYRLIPFEAKMEKISFVISLSVTLIGLFIMVSRISALTQIIGLLVMENGLFLAAAIISGGMPFFVEIAIFFDLFVFVIIVGIFVYRINKLFTHIDVNKLDELRG